MPLKMGLIGCPEMSVNNYQIYDPKHPGEARTLAQSSAEQQRIQSVKSLANNFNHVCCIFQK
jgi:hypothetical protein